ncbi:MULTISPECIES: energy transducer TonB family protein [Asticcacaulis]|uniref:TonB C-terminal domain-containing protein n=1 Tax=Asticcacaulis endophyticus TaxID=1395890 RepID=A0A918Q9Q2_9CAUL|nr:MULTISPECIES: energy transducer TonB [Asticcacaulis]WKL58953.1 energy transducer TonB [Asticcacaulis sp. ZE23SCel15]GGZ38573.1 hypothetical protein GCM10011273_26480 [Asticcacaulis endophyticus]
MIEPPKFRLRDNVPVILLGVIVAAALLLAGWWLWPKGEAVRTERVIQEIALATPPPPPEPPKPEEKVIEEPEEVAPVEQPSPQPPSPTPSETPSDAPPSPSTEAAGLDRLADAGSDSFRLSSGKGGGLFGRGGGGGGGDWDAAVALHITRALQRDPRTRSAKGSVKVAVTIDAKGQFTSARLLSSTGDPELDAHIRAVLSEIGPMSRGRPPGVNGSLNFTINLKRSAG